MRDTCASPPTPRTRREALAAGRWAALIAAVLSSGCSTQHAQLVSFVHENEAETATGSYVVRPPDFLAFHAPRIPEVDGASQMVRSDGKIVMRLLGEVDVAGLTTAEIADKLEAQLSRYYVEPKVVVEVARYNSQFYYVFGEVQNPGPVRFTGRDTLLMALAQARPNVFAWRSQVKISRPSDQPGERRVITVDLDKMVTDADTSMNFLLQEGDIVEVPPTPLAWVGHRVREVLYPVQPIISAYNAPAETIQSTRTYDDEFGGGSDDRSFRERFGR